ncbi:sal-like protein 3 [Engraulis encrasicolus]|uniref:sal-like protein 3 n=1 Tax=Engraulis encrasicolus TaxID=184585 RepID=UPI002FD2E2AD
MSRRKQKRPQQLINADPGGTRILLQDEQLGVKSPSASLASDATSSPHSSSSPSSSSSSPPAIQDHHPPLAPRPSPGGLHAPSLPSESSSPPHWLNHHIAPYTTSLPNTLSSLSPDFPHPSLSSQTHSSPPGHAKTSHSHSHSHGHSHHPLARQPSHQPHPHSAMTSPQLGISATTTTSSALSSALSSSSSSSSSLGGAPRHHGSASPVQQPTPPSPPAAVQMPPTLAVLLEELRVLQQRQIHQMQITEEICRQVLRLGGGLNATQDGGSAQVPGSGGQRSNGDSSSPSPPHIVSGTSMASAVSTAASLLSSIPSLLQSTSTSSAGSKTNGQSSSKTTPSALTSSALTSVSSALAAAAASLHPLSLSLGLPTRFLPHDATSGKSHGAATNPFSHTNGLTSSVAASSTTSSSSAAAATASSGRQQHACRFCGKVLSSDSSLQIHLRSHTGERPYQCPVCLSRFTTRGNLKAHFLRHREQNPELSLSLLPPALSEGSSQSGSSGGAGGTNGTGPRSRKRRAEQSSEQESFGVKGALGVVPDSMAASLGFLSGSAGRPSPSSLPLPPSVDLALLSTAHSLLQLNRTSSSSANASTTSSPSSSSSSAGPLKGSKQQRFDENTPPHSALLAAAAAAGGSPYSQLAHLPKILFPGGAAGAHHHPGLALLHPSSLASPHGQLAFPFSPYPGKASAASSSSPSSSTSPSSSSTTSDTSKLQRLAQKLEKQPQGGAHSLSSSDAPTSSSDVTSSSSASSAYRREMMAALGLNPNINLDLSGGSGGIQASSVATTTSSPSLMSPSGTGTGTTALSANQCGVCLRVLSCPQALRLHQATHLGERPFPCKQCGRSFSTKGSLRAHVAAHHSRSQANGGAGRAQQNSCPLCQRKFTNALVLQHHIRLHLGGQIPPDGNGTEEQEKEMHVEDAAGDAEIGSPQEDHPTNLSMGSQDKPLDLGSSSSNKALSLVLSAPDNDGSVHREPVSLLADLSVKSNLERGGGVFAEAAGLAASAETEKQDPLSLVMSRPQMLNGPSAAASALLKSGDLTTAPYHSTSHSLMSSHSHSVQQDDADADADADADDMAPLSLCVRADRSGSGESESVVSLSRAKSPAPTISTVVKAPTATVVVSEATDTPSALTPPSSPGSANEGPATQAEPVAETCTDDDATSPTTAEPASHAVTAAPQNGLQATGEGEDVAMEEENREEDEEEEKEIEEKEELKEEEEDKGAEGTEEETQPVTPVKTSRGARAEKPVYTCNQCGKEYASRSGLKGHMKVHSGPVTPKAIKTAKDTSEEPSAISTNSVVAEEEADKPPANQDKSCDTDEPMETSGVAEEEAE